MTNRDLYLFVAALPRSERSLESYLRSLWRLVRARRSQPGLDGGELAEALSAALTSEPLAYDPVWVDAGDGAGGWESTLRRQIVDLRELAAAGTLAREDRYFGVDAPRGGRWYNFDPNTYLECAVTGTFGGWREGDDSGRCYVPGPSVALADTGAVVSIDSRSIDDPIDAIGLVDWARFEQFLWCGQTYE